MNIIYKNTFKENNTPINPILEFNLNCYNCEVTIDLVTCFDYASFNNIKHIYAIM